MKKNIYFFLIACSLLLLPFAWMWRAKHVILNFHRITDEPNGYEYWFSVAKYRMLVEYIGKRFPIVTLPDRNEVGQGGVTFTFDDGYEDLYTNVLPLMQSRGFPFYIFVITSMFSGSSYRWVGGVKHLNVSQMQDMTAGGAIVGLHCHNHVDYTRLSQAELLQEIKNGIDVLERSGLSFERRVMCLPYGQGNFSAGFEETLRKSGFSSILSTYWGGVNQRPQFFLKRYPIYSYDNNFSVAMKISGCTDWIFALQIFLNWRRNRVYKA